RHADRDLAQRSAIDVRRHADVAVGDHADEPSSAVFLVLDYGNAAAVLFPHDPGGSVRGLASAARPDIPIHDLADSQHGSSSSLPAATRNLDGGAQEISCPRSVPLVSLRWPATLLMSLAAASTVVLVFTRRVMVRSLARPGRAELQPAGDQRRVSAAPSRMAGAHIDCRKYRAHWRRCVRQRVRGVLDPPGTHCLPSRAVSATLEVIRALFDDSLHAQRVFLAEHAA